MTVLSGPEADRAQDLTSDFIERITNPSPTAAPVSPQEWAGSLAGEAEIAASIGQAAVQTLRQVMSSEGGWEEARDIVMSNARLSLEEMYPYDDLLLGKEGRGGDVDAQRTGSRTWSLHLDAGGQDGALRVEGCSFGMTLHDERGDAIMSVVANPGGHPSSSVAVSVRGSGVRYWPESGPDKGGQMFLTRPENMARCWDQVDFPLPHSLLSSPILSSPHLSSRLLS